MGAGIWGGRLGQTAEGRPLLENASLRRPSSAYAPLRILHIYTLHPSLHLASLPLLPEASLLPFLLLLLCCSVKLDVLVLGPLVSGHSQLLRVGKMAENHVKGNNLEGLEALANENVDLVSHSLPPPPVFVG